MRKVLILAALSTLMVLPEGLLAQPWGTCTSQHVNADICRSTDHDFACLDFPSSVRQDVISWAQETSGWQEDVLCDTNRRVTDGILTVAGVTEGDCLPTEVGQFVTNPQPPGQVVYARIRFLVIAEAREWLDQRKQSAARVEVDPEPRPDIGADDEPPG